MNFINKAFDGAAKFFGYTPTVQFEEAEKAYDTLNDDFQSMCAALRDCAALENFADHIGLESVSVEHIKGNTVLFVTGWDVGMATKAFAKMGFRFERLPDIEIDITDQVSPEKAPPTNVGHSNVKLPENPADSDPLEGLKKVKDAEAVGMPENSLPERMTDEEKTTTDFGYLSKEPKGFA